MNEQARVHEQSHAQQHADLRFGTAITGWFGLEVVRFEALEAISACFRFEITLLRRNVLEPLDLDAMLDAPASLAIATMGGHRVVHGIVGEVALLEHTPTLQLYRVLLVPHLWRARFRRRCRSFVYRTIQEVVDMVLRNATLDGKSVEAGGLEKLDADPPEAPATVRFESYGDPIGCYRWRMRDDQRLIDGAVKMLIVQYNETDYELVCRLLAEQGVSFYFEDILEGSLMVITDVPSQVSTVTAQRRYALRSHREAGSADDGEVFLNITARRAMMPTSVTVRDYRWFRSREVAETPKRLSKSTHSDYFVFPGCDEHGDEPGEHPSIVRGERFQTESLETRATSTARRLLPGHVFLLEDPASLHGSHEYMTVSVSTRASQLDMPGTSVEDPSFPAAPSFRNEVCVVPKAAPYRPPLAKPAPLIAGVQSATVTAEETNDSSKEINAHKYGQVRVRFAWDQRPADGTPSSPWIRVSQLWAGQGWGALFTPRVGQEVLVAFRDGDPERPMIVGRAYNDQHAPPYDPEKHAELAGIKSHSSPNAEKGFNEIRFQDKTGKEELYLHAQKDMNEHVNNCHGTFVGSDQTHVVKGMRQRTVFKDEIVIVHGERQRTIHQSDVQTVYQDREHIIKQSEFLTVTGNRSVTVQEGDLSIKVNNGLRNVYVAGHDKHQIDGSREVQVMKGQTFNVFGDDQKFQVAKTFQVASKATLFATETSFEVFSKQASHAQDSFSVVSGAAQLLVDLKSMVLLDSGSGAKVMLVGDQLVLSGKNITLKASNTVKIHGTKIELAGGEITESAAMVKMNS